MGSLAGYADALLHIAIGLGLSVAGFRILVPFLMMSIAAYTGHLKLAPEMAWVGTKEASVAFAIATILEVLVYFIPVVDNFMDLIEVPAAAIAGTVLTATVTSDLNPLLRWSLVAIAVAQLQAHRSVYGSHPPGFNSRSRSIWQCGRFVNRTGKFDGALNFIDRGSNTDRSGGSD